MTAYLRAVLTRELRALERELQAYASEADMWKPAPGIRNSAGTLALHLAGNLRHFIGARLGRTGYVRARDAEFSRRGVPRAELIAEIERAVADVGATLDRLDDGDLEQPYPDVVGGVRVKTGDFLVHLAAHLAYHLGQVDYHRRLVTGSEETVGAVAIPELGSAESVGSG